MKPPHWTEVTPSQYEWERQGLEFIREGLPDHEPYRAWSNFEFVASDGQIYEVDLLVLAKLGFWLVELKGRPGVVSGDAQTWTEPGGRRVTADNPYLLANRKAKALASRLRATDAMRRSKSPLPFLEAAVFLPDPEVECQLKGLAAAHVFVRDRPPGDPSGARPGILAALLRREGEHLDPAPRSPIDAAAGRALARAIDECGIRPSRKSRRVGDYVCGGLLAEGPGYQDFAAEHASLKGVHRRIRCYLSAAAASEDERERLRRAAQREFRSLHLLDHPGILKAHEYRDDETGPVIVFDHDPRYIRLDHHLAALSRGGKPPSADLKLEILRQSAEAVRYAHTRGVIHRALGPESVLLADPGVERPLVKLFNWQASARDRLPQSSSLTSVEGLVETGAMVYIAPEAVSSRAEVSKAADVFSLGALAYLLFTGRPPAPTRAALHELLREHGGLKVAAVLDGAGSALDALIYVSTCPEVDQRTSSAEEFLAVLDEVEDELTRPEPRTFVDPLQAKKGDELEGGWVVERALGRGSTALALLARRKPGEEGGEAIERVILFDFSLARAPLENIDLGTPPYHDPFLELRKPRRWDPAAVTLFEMAAGAGCFPRWGDGRSDPAVTRAPLALDPSRFDAGARERRPTVSPEGEETEGVPALRLDGVRPDTPVAAIGLSTRAVSALDRIDVLRVRELARLSLGKVQVLRGVGQKTRGEIRAAVTAVRERFPELVLEAPPAEPTAPAGERAFEDATVEDPSYASSARGRRRPGTRAGSRPRRSSGWATSAPSPATGRRRLRWRAGGGSRSRASRSRCRACGRAGARRSRG
jgi:serine/threonine protein kinase